MPDHNLGNPEHLQIDRRQAVNADHIAKMTRHPDVFRRQPIGSLAGSLDGDTWRGRSSAGWTVGVNRFRENVLRLTMTPRGVDDLTPTYALPRGSTADGELRVVEDATTYRFDCGGPHLVLAKADGMPTVLSAAERVLLHGTQAPEVVSSIMAGTVEVGVGFDIDPRDAFHGLGDKPGQLDMRGRRYTLWNTDAFGYDQKSDAVYKSIPFVLLERGDRRLGLFFNNTARAHFDFGREDVEVFRYEADGGPIDVFLIFGDDPVEICASYCRLTGTPPLPPLWALGYQQCRWSYYPEARVREVVDEFRTRRIPCDAIYLDIDYMDAYKCFTWSELLFPDLKGMIADFRERSMRTVVMIDPGISAVEFYDVYEQGSYENAWCRRTSGEVMRGPVWPEECVFPDFTRPDVRAWWGELYRELYVEQGVSGFWNDMNEPAVFKVDRATFPDAVMHDMDGHPCTHARAHNVYGLTMTEASFEGLRKLQPGVRPFLLTRATFSGGQRYAATWTGDNTASWRHLQIANHQCIRLSLSGFGLCGSDIGGFHHDPDGELYTRWVQLAVFHPLMRTHSMGNNADGSTQTDSEAVASAQAADRRDQEPWSYGDPWTAIARTAIEWRYRLLPVIYTAVEAMHRAGTPPLVPIYMDDPSDRLLVDKHAFRFGEHLFVDPVTRPGQLQKQVRFPRGRWYRLETGACVEGGQVRYVQTPYERLACWVRGGAVLQLDAVRQSTGEPVTVAPEWHLYHAPGETVSTLYQDAGEGYAHEGGEYSRTRFTYRGEPDRSTVSITREGDYVPAVREVELVWHGSGEGDWTLWVDGAEVEVTRSPSGKTLDGTAAAGHAYRARVSTAAAELVMRRVGE